MNSEDVSHGSLRRADPLGLLLEPVPARDDRVARVSRRAAARAGPPSPGGSRRPGARGRRARRRPRPRAGAAGAGGCAKAPARCRTHAEDQPQEARDQGDPITRPDRAEDGVADAGSPSARWGRPAPPSVGNEPVSCTGAMLGSTQGAADDPLRAGARGEHDHQQHQADRQHREHDRTRARPPGRHGKHRNRPLARGSITSRSQLRGPRSRHRPPPGERGPVRRGSEDRVERLGAVHEPEPGDPGVGLGEGQLLGQVADVVGGRERARPSVDSTPTALPPAVMNPEPESPGMPGARV